MLCNSRSGRIGLLIPARSLLADDGTRVSLFELICTLKRGHLTAEQLEESDWEAIDAAGFRRLWQVEVEEASASHKRERLHLATGFLLPVWDKLPSDYVRVIRISAREPRADDATDERCIAGGHCAGARRPARWPDDFGILSNQWRLRAMVSLRTISR